MLTRPSLCDSLRHVALRVRGIKSEIAHCIAGQPRPSTAWEKLAAVRD